MARITNLSDGEHADYEVVVYNGLYEGELVVAIQRHGIVIIRVTVAPHGPPQVMLADPPAEQRQ